MPQQATIGPAPMEGVKRMNTVVVRGQRAGVRQNVGPLQRRDLFAMEVDQGRNYYACGGFRHIVCYCRNWGQRGRVVENRRVEYEGGRIEEITNNLNNLKGEENLEFLD